MDPSNSKITPSAVLLLSGVRSCVVYSDLVVTSKTYLRTVTEATLISCDGGFLYGKVTTSARLCVCVCVLMCFGGLCNAGKLRVGEVQGTCSSHQSRR